MKYAYCLALALTSCAHQQLTCDQYCALDNMICSGKSDGESTSVAAAWGMYPMKSRGHNTTYHCSRDESKAAQIQAAKDSINAKAVTDMKKPEDWQCAPGRKATDSDLKLRCEKFGM